MQTKFLKSAIIELLTVDANRPIANRKINQIGKLDFNIQRFLAKLL